MARATSGNAGAGQSRSSGVVAPVRGQTRNHHQVPTECSPKHPAEAAQRLCPAVKGPQTQELQAGGSPSAQERGSRPSTGPMTLTTLSGLAAQNRATSTSGLQGEMGVGGGRAGWGGLLRVPAPGAGAGRRAGRRRHTQLNAINKTFIQTMAEQGTIPIFSFKKKGEERGVSRALGAFVRGLQGGSTFSHRVRPPWTMSEQNHTS